MFGTVRTRILFFAFLSVFAVAGLSALSWSIILKAEDASKTLIQTNLNEAWRISNRTTGTSRILRTRSRPSFCCGMKSRPSSAVWRPLCRHIGRVWKRIRG